GSGKTTLVSAWAAQSRGEVAWLALERDDNDLGRFLDALCGALGALFPAGGADLARLRSGSFPSPRAMVRLLIDALRGYVDGPAEAPGARFLEDYPLISAQPVHDALADLVDYLPPGLRIILICRAEPPLPLARWRVGDRLLDLRAADLRFSL